MLMFVSQPVGWFNEEMKWLLTPYLPEKIKILQIQLNSALTELT